MRELEMKSFGSFEIKDEERGEVMAVVATLEVVDKDGDVILPGAIPMGGAKVKLSGYGHDVITQDAPPVGIGMITEEGGKAVFNGRFFMSTVRGRESFMTVKELGTDGQWSFGFPTRSIKTRKMTDEWKEKGARRLISEMQPIEASPVFIGAGEGTMTLHVKSVKAADSLTDRLRAVHDALWERNEADESALPWWAEEVFEDHMIVQEGTGFMRVAYEMDDEGNVTLGEATEVERVWQEKAAEGEEETKGEGDAAAEEQEAEGVEDPEEAAGDEVTGDGTGEVLPEIDEEKAAEEAVEEQRKAKAQAAVEEYERVQRTLKRLRVV